MRKFLTIAAAVGLALISGAAAAREKVIGTPGAVVHVQEITTSFQVLFNNYCPVSAAGTFDGQCGLKTGYYFKEPIVNANVNWVNTGQFKYMVQWVPAKAPGTYAWVSARGGLSNEFLSVETQLVKVAPGTVVVDSLYTKGSQSDRNSVLKRVKEMFAGQYGREVANQMNFVHVRAAPASCAKRRDVAKGADNCRLK